MKSTQLSAYKAASMASDFCSVSSINSLCNLLCINKQGLWNYANNPSYKPFYISKKAGGYRYVEDPIDGLKKIQRSLNDYLQCAYFVNRTEAAYGYVVNVDTDPTPRNILTNAQQHVNKSWLLNIDFSDFFHSVKYQQVYNIFHGEPFGFNAKLCHTLAKLTTFEGRLPMGSPTSPVLSNFETRELDQNFMAFAKTNDFVYTRFADDLSFSSNTEISEQMVSLIKKISVAHGFVVNPTKTKLFSPNEEKVVTGLKVSDHVELPNGYYQNIQKEIEKYRNIMEIQYRTGYKNTNWVNKYQQQIKGVIEFAGFVLGKKSYEYQQLVDAYDRATFPMPDLFESVSWLDFNYQ